MPQPEVDVDLLRRLGLLPNDEGQGGELPSFPRINVGPRFGPQLEDAMNPPLGVLPPAAGEGATIPQPPVTSEAVPGPVGNAAASLPTPSTFPWDVEIPGVGPFGKPTAARSTVPMTEQNGTYTITAPEGTASFQRATPEATADWLRRKTEEQTAQREAGYRRAEVTQQLAQLKQREQERQVAEQQQVQQGQQRQQQTLIDTLAQRDPKAALEFLQRIQADRTQQATASRANLTGTPESQAFRQVAATEGLPAALAWLKDHETAKVKAGAATGPEATYQKTAAEMAARYGPEAQGLRADTAAKTTGARLQAQANPDLPLSMDQASKFGVVPGTTRRALYGELLTTNKERAAMGELTSGRFLLDRLQQSVDNLIWAESPMEAAAQGAVLYKGALVKDNAEAATYMDQRKALLGILSRQIGAERGVLTDRDIERINDALPHFTDTVEIKNMKMSLLKGMFDVNQDARKRAISSWESLNGKFGEGNVVQKFAPAAGRTSSPAAPMTELPPASSHSGKVIRDRETGKRYRSDGQQWRPI